MTRVGGNHPPVDGPCAKCRRRTRIHQEILIPTADPGLGARDPTKHWKQKSSLRASAADRRRVDLDRSIARATTACRHDAATGGYPRSNSMPSTSHHNSAPRGLQMRGRGRRPRRTRVRPRDYAIEIRDKNMRTCETGTRLAAEPWPAHVPPNRSGLI